MVRIRLAALKLETVVWEPSLAKFASNKTGIVPYLDSDV